MLQELRFAIRMLLKQPGFSLIAALTLAPAGVGARSRDSGCRVRRVCLGCAADGKQLAGDDGH